MERRWRAVLSMTSFGAVAVFAACQLFIDPDNLSNGDRGTDAGDASAAGDAGGFAGDASVADAPEWKGQVPACAPQPPGGAQVVAVVGGAPGFVRPCPSGYEPTGESGFLEVVDRDFQCNNGTCACGAVVPSASNCLNISLDYFSDPSCATTVAAPDSLAACAGMSRGGPYVKMVGTLNPSLVCPPSGVAGVVAQAPRIGSEVDLCKPAAPPADGGCEGTDVPLPPTSDAVACYRSSSASCAAGYTAGSTFSADRTMADDRKCACACRADPDGGCAGGSVATYGGTDCSAVVGTIPGDCLPASDYSGQLAEVNIPPPPIEPACIPTPTKSGDVTLTGPPLFLCCLTPCEACGRAATSPGGPCASAFQACFADTACKDYLFGDAGADAGADAGEGGAASAPPGYAAILSCRASACKAACE